MPEAQDSSGRWTQRLSRTARVGAIVLASLAAAFGVLLLINSQAIVGSANDRNAHDLEIVGKAIETWPRTFGEAARLQFLEAPLTQEEDGRNSFTLVHPDLGPIKTTYGKCPAGADTGPAAAAAQDGAAKPGQLFPPGARAGQGSIFKLEGRFLHTPTGQEVCYSTEVAMDRLVGLERTDALSNVVIVGADESVLVQFGSPSLPITKVPPLAAANSFAKDLAAGLMLQTEKSDEQQVALATTTGASRTRIGDRDYLVYVQPFHVDVPAWQCPQGGQSGEARGSQPPETDTITRPCQLYALGFMQADAMNRAWFKPPPLVLIGFGLALLIALALLPTMRLLMIGGTESVSAAEMGAISFGIFAATSVAALAVLFAIEVAGERALASDESRVEARQLASRAGNELRLFRASAGACAKSNPSEAQVKAVRDGPAIYEAAFFTAQGTPEERPAKPWCTNQAVPSRANISARPYFQDLLARPAVVDRGNLPRDEEGAAPTVIASVFGQVRSQTDGINKSIVVLALRGTDDQKTPGQYFLASTVLRPLVSPVLPPPQEFMVVDTSDPQLPVVFHRNPARIEIDKFASQVPGRLEVTAALRRLGGQRGGDARGVGQRVQDEVTPLDFERRFEGKVTHFAAARIAGSPWVVLVYHRLDDADDIAAQTATRALAGWAGITLPAMAICVVLLLLFPESWRYLWPFRDGVAVYTAATWSLGVGALLIAIIALVDFSHRSYLAVAIAAVAAAIVFFGQRRSLRQRVWRYAWPLRERVPIRRKAWLLWIQSTLWLWVGALPIAIIAMIVFPQQPLTAVVMATAGAWSIYVCLRRKTLDARPLTVAHERSYRRFVLAMLVFIAVAPMIAFWADARSLSLELTDIGRQENAATAIDERFRQIGRLSTVLARPALTVDGRPIAEEARPFSSNRMNPWSRPTVSGRIGDIATGGFSHLLMAWQSPIAFTTINRCRFDGGAGWAGKAGPAGARSWYCWRSSGDGTRIGVAERPTATPQGAPAFALIVIVALALTALIYAVVYFGLRALTGFGIPLGAVTWPKLVLEGDPDEGKNELRLANKSLLVAPQQAVRNRISRSAMVVDIADILLPLTDKALTPDSGASIDVLPAWKGEKSRLVVSGLELVLRDPVRRRVALAYLERAARFASTPNQRPHTPERPRGALARLKRAATIASGAEDGLEHELVVIVEMSPLERILDAFDSFGKGRALDSDVREELRWARLFQDFTTFSFAPIDKVDQDAVDSHEPTLAPTAKILIDELRWLPGNVIDGVIVPRGTVRQVELKTEDQGRFPLPDYAYRTFYTPPIIAWARSADAITPAAAVDYMRANLIEYYEQCWAASSLSERVILDAIARNSYVNMRKAVALQSLVRRGLVILDPAPRLMNLSFAMYIRQAERPDTLERWRKQQPRSPWSLARLPLAIVVPVLIIGVTMAAAESGQAITALVSLLAAGMPALIGSVVRTARGSG